MSDNKNKTAPQDGKFINVKEDYEVQYWTEKFKVTSQQLKEAVDKVGTSVVAVTKFFKK